MEPDKDELSERELCVAAVASLTTEIDRVYGVEKAIKTRLLLINLARTLVEATPDILYQPFTKGSKIEEAIGDATDPESLELLVRSVEAELRHNAVMQDVLQETFYDARVRLVAAFKGDV